MQYYLYFAKLEYSIYFVKKNTMVVTTNQSENSRNGTTVDERFIKGS